MDVNFRTSCKSCKYISKCLLCGNSRMIKKKCYLDVISEKLKIKPETVVERCNTFVKKFGFENFSFIQKEMVRVQSRYVVGSYQTKEIGWIDKEEWLTMSNRQRTKEITMALESLRNNNCNVTTEDVKMVVAVANCYFSAWRDEKYIHCAKCGELIENSKQRNRKYCDRCKNIHSDKKIIRYKTCIDCGCKFEVWHNREVRCINCQIKANKSASRERTKRYRDKKRNGLEKKS